MKNKELRAALFRVLAKDAMDFNLVDDFSIICPLCWTKCSEENASLEHILPQSVGGKRMTITCTKCNNQSGKSLDVHLANYLEFQRAVADGAPLKTKFEVNGNKITCNMSKNDGVYDIFPVPKATKPKDLEQLFDDFRNGRVKQMNMSGSLGYSYNGYKNALVRSAYLSLFDRFGYEYASHPVGQLIRSHLKAGSEEVFGLKKMILTIDSSITEHFRPYIILNTTFHDMHTRLVLLRLYKKGVEKILGVFLPNNCDCFDNFREYTKNDMEPPNVSFKNPEIIMPIDRISAT